MRTEDKIKDEKLQYDIDREIGKMSAVSSGKIDKDKHLTGEEILPSIQSKLTEQAKIRYSLLRKPLEKQTKKRVDSKIDELKQFGIIFAQNQLNDLINNRLKEIQ